MGFVRLTIGATVRRSSLFVRSRGRSGPAQIRTAVTATRRPKDTKLPHRPAREKSTVARLIVPFADSVGTVWIVSVRTSHRRYSNCPVDAGRGRPAQAEQSGGTGVVLLNAHGRAIVGRQARAAPPARGINQQELADTSPVERWCASEPWEPPRSQSAGAGVCYTAERAGVVGQIRTVTLELRLCSGSHPQSWILVRCLWC